MIRFETESGSVYEIRRTPWDYSEVRRVNTGAEKRADGEWVRLISFSTLEVGYPLLLEMENLGKYGPDDEGNRHGSFVTHRTTTVVTSIEGELA